MTRQIRSRLFLKDDMAATIRAIAMANDRESPDFYRALVCVALALGLEPLARELGQLAGDDPKLDARLRRLP